ncbi:MAG TPA: GNAT family N-acetyltransferase [Ignavibacteria bacterium]|nr:GNAT family N-acetyltransferase [Ignavibacteria bacterium]HMQ98381.1 GNAT family N-acetyltransferase [Ignavibacteria bacterium]
MNYKLRKASPGDLYLSFDIRKNAMYKYIADSKGWNEEKEMQDHIEDFNTDIMQIIEAGGKPVGVFENVADDRYIYVHGLYILEEFQNYKIGSQVINSIVNTAKTEKRSILLQVLKVNSKAKVFYERFGFKVYSENEQHYKMIYYFSDK